MRGLEWYNKIGTFSINVVVFGWVLWYDMRSIQLRQYTEMKTNLTTWKDMPVKQ